MTISALRAQVCDLCVRLQRSIRELMWNTPESEVMSDDDRQLYEILVGAYGNVLCALDVLDALAATQDPSEPCPEKTTE